DRRDAAGARRSRAPGQGPLYRLLDPVGLAGRRGALDLDAFRARAVYRLPGALQPARSRPRPRDAADDRGPRSGADPVLATGQWAVDRQIPPRRAAADRDPLRQPAAAR